MMPSDLRAFIKRKPIAIFGYGTSGRGVKALADRMEIESTCFDEREIEGTRQEFSTADARQHSVVVASPGFDPSHPWFAVARAAGLEVFSELDFGSLFLSHPVWAVTGTNGKTSTCQYLAHTLNLTGQGAVCVGNIGVSLCGWLAQNLDEEPHTRLIVEISSFQALQIRRLNIEGLLWTNFSENHLNHHRDLAEYFDAKWSLVSRLVRPLLVMGQSVFEYLVAQKKEIPDFALVVPNRSNGPADALPENSVFAQPPFDENFRLCVAFGERVGLPRLLLHQTAQTFRLPKHRLARIAAFDGIEFFNDAKSTTFESTLGALRRFDQKVLWIGGGESKGGDLARFARELAPKLKSAYLIGQTGETMTALLRKEGLIATHCGKLERAVSLAVAEAEAGDVVLLSPGFSSLDQFESFAQRGNLFEKLVFELQAAAAGRTKA